MKVSWFRLRNYRRLLDIKLMLDDKKTILVGANNSGKTSCIGALHTFLVRPENLRIRDASKQSWREISSLGRELEASEITSEQLESIGDKLCKLLPSLDVTISAMAAEAYRARDILPHLDWKGGPLAVRIVYAPENMTRLAADFKQAREVVAEHEGVALWPKHLFDFFEKGNNLTKYIKQKHFILNLETADDAPPSVQPLSASALKKLIRVNVISEQRGLGNDDKDNEKGPYSEKQRLNKLLSEYYNHFLNPDDFPEAGDLEVLQKQQQMEQGFSKRLKKQFKAPLKELEHMGYPGIGGNPRVEIAAKISGTDALQKSSSVGYRFDNNQDDSLPESYLGLGYQNLIYLTFRLLEFRDRWMRIGKSVSSDEELTELIEPIHLVLVEEPEVNLHAQVQRVFIAQAYKTLRNHKDLKDNSRLQTQLVVSTHSSHIVNDVDFSDLRYFRRISASDDVKMDYSLVENMSDLFDTDRAELKFVSKHLKLTHCDIFFADGVIFVEGQAERLLIPEFISSKFADLSKRYLSVIEVNGAHTHKYKEIVEKLGVVTLVITDLDSQDSKGGKCAPQRGQDQTSSNNTLRNWHPKRSSVDELVDLSKDECDSKSQTAPLYVAYQRAITLGDTEVLSRTFEDALILANFDSAFFQEKTAIKAAKKSARDGTKSLEQSLFEYVRGLAKGDFAFDCLMHIAEAPNQPIKPPLYIAEGLDWLQSQLSPKL